MRSPSILGIGPSWPADLSQWWTQGNLPMCSLFSFHGGRTSSPSREQIEQWGWPDAIWCRRNKRILLALKTRKDNTTQGDKPSTAVWALCLLVRKCSRPGVHSYAAEWGSKDYRHEIAFLNTWLARLLFPSLLWLLRISDIFYFFIYIFSLSQFS